MSQLQRVALMLELIKKHGFTAYELAKGTGLTSFGIQKIINQETKKPSADTLDKIFKYMESKMVGRAIPGHANYDPEYETKIVSEPPPLNNQDIYKEHYELLKKCGSLEMEIERLQAILDKHGIKY